MKTTTKEKNHALSNAKCWMESITEMVEKWEAIHDSVLEENRNKTDEIETEIQESVLSVEVRSGWYSPSTLDKLKPEEFKILLTTGGPALRLIGGLSEHGEPENARLEYQDWGTPWTEYRTTSEENEKLLAFAQRFYFGE